MAAHHSLQPMAATQMAPSSELSRRFASGPSVRLGSLVRPVALRAKPISTRGRDTRLSALSVSAAEVKAFSAEDKWLEANMPKFAAAEVPAALQSARDAAASALATMRMPTTRNEEYRFTDLSGLLKEELVMPEAGASPDVEGCTFEAAKGCRVVVVDGVIRDDLSCLDDLPKGLYVGPIAGAPASAQAAAGQQAASRGGVFAAMASAAASDALVISAEAGARGDVPIHVVYASSSSTAGAMPASSPVTVVHVAEGASVSVVEEFTGGEGKYFTNQVTEIVLEEGGELDHACLQLQGHGAYHLKATLVEQQARSAYRLTEVTLGGMMTRHDLGSEQLGEETRTEFHSFILAGAEQLHDLHSKLKLDHPRGTADQLHKCIVSHGTGRGVFDGNVKVNRYAQETDAGQLTRNLLLAPKATVNVKPNLQIIADDVACTHGCAISDLEEEELFYFQSRGIDLDTARRCLVFSFGLEVVNRLPWQDLRKRVESETGEALALSGYGI